MGKQFKTFTDVSRQISRDNPELENASVNRNIGTNAPGGGNPFLHLPMSSSAQISQSAPARDIFPETRESFPPSAHPQPPQPSSAGAQEAEQQQRARTWLQQKKQKRQRKGRGMMVAVLSCFCLLVLSGGGFWLYQMRMNVSSTAPAAAPTQTRYTIVSGAPTSTATADATATVKPSGTSPSFTPPIILNPVPAPWQTDSQLIVVSISAQKLTAYDHGKPAMTILVTTGMPALYTPQATYHIIGRAANAMFYSPWPPSSPYYYAPIHVNYGLQLTSSGIYLHDATWRSVFGPGTNVPHTDPVYGSSTGSHGCVELPLQAMHWLYNWAANGIPVAVIG